MRRFLRPLLVLLATGPLATACVRPATGVTLTVDSSRLLDLGIAIDLFRVTPSTASGPLEVQELAIIGRPVQAIETFTINLPGELGGQRVFLLVEAVQADAVVGAGSTEAELIAEEHVPVQVILRLCEAASGPFCDGDELVTCDAVTDETIREVCLFSCNAEQLRCNDCVPSTSACNGDVLVDCDADGNITGATISCASLGLVCVVDDCVDCTPGLIDCRPDPAPALSGTIVVCDSKGTIATSTGCPYGCMDESAACHDCFAGTTHCIGDDLVDCAADGTIAAQNPCTYGCNEAASACNECTPAPAGTTSLECHGDDLVECDDEGGFVANTLCTTFGCNTTIDPDACNVCDPDPTIVLQCIGDEEVSCSTGGQIVTSVDCAAMGSACNPLTGTCNSCTPGASECQGSSFVVCSATGTIISSTPCGLLADGCNSGACSPAGCVAVPLADGTLCDDGAYCTIDETCSGGVCGSTTPRSCADTSDCTVDTCDEATDSCVFDFSTTGGLGCDDALFCTIGTTCTAGLCGGGSPRSCTDTNPCTFDSCDEPSDSCVNDPTGSENLFCGTDLICCGGSCIDSDEANCGECGHVCPTPLPGCLPADLCFHNTCIDAGILVITELAIDPGAVGDVVGEWIEVYNPGLLPIDLRGWVLRDDGTNLHNISTAVPVIVPAGGFAVLVKSNTPATNCGVTGTYQYSSFDLGNSGDEVVLEASGCLVDRVNYPGTFETSGSAMNLSSTTFSATLNDSVSNWCSATATMMCGDEGSPGMSNIACP